ncbi:MAG: molybdenum cofactor biosynthesis protein MoaE [Pseudomonadota bacterium]
MFGDNPQAGTFSVRVGPADFDPGREVASLEAKIAGAGALVTFQGIVRGDATLVALEIEHYPAMTDAALSEIAAHAGARWPLAGVRIVHRVGRLGAGDRIMMVATASRHRREAFEAAEFLMDYLKSRAPFWKKEHFADGTARWVEARDEDEAALGRWGADI